MSYKERISFADDLIFNDGSLETFLAKLDFYYKLYDKLAWLKKLILPAQTAKRLSRSIQNTNPFVLVLVKVLIS